MEIIISKGGEGWQGVREKQGQSREKMAPAVFDFLTAGLCLQHEPLAAQDRHY
jgi:hypothetical protein